MVESPSLQPTSFVVPRTPYFLRIAVSDATGTECPACARSYSSAGGSPVLQFLNALQAEYTYGLNSTTTGTFSFPSGEPTFTGAVSACIGPSLLVRQGAARHVPEDGDRHAAPTNDLPDASVTLGVNPFLQRFPNATYTVCCCWEKRCNAMVQPWIGKLRWGGIICGRGGPLAIRQNPKLLTSVVWHLLRLQHYGGATCRDARRCLVRVNGRRVWHDVELRAAPGSCHPRAYGLSSPPHNDCVVSVVCPGASEPLVKSGGDASGACHLSHRLWHHLGLFDSTTSTALLQTLIYHSSRILAVFLGWQWSQLSNGCFSKLAYPTQAPAHGVLTCHHIVALGKSDSLVGTVQCERHTRLRSTPCTVFQL